MKLTKTTKTVIESGRSDTSRERSGGFVEKASSQPEVKEQTDNCLTGKRFETRNP